LFSEHYPPVSTRKHRGAQLSDETSKGREVKLLIADQKIRVIDANGELIRELTLDPSRCY
jgi:hypothetical protein